MNVSTLVSSCYGSISAYLALPHARERSPRCFLNRAYVLRLFCLLSRSSPTKSRRSNGAHSKGTLPVASCGCVCGHVMSENFTNALVVLNIYGFT